MPWSEAERAYIEYAPVGRLATADEDGRPHAVPICFALLDETIVTPIDEKPKDRGTRELRRLQNIRANPRVTLVVDHYTEEWADLGWVQIRGTATVLEPDADGHRKAVTALRGKYDQYESHALEDRPVIRIDPGQVVSWGRLSRPERR